MRFTVQGSESLDTLSRRFAAAAEHGLPDELRSALEQVESGLRNALVESALSKLPRGGGLNRVVADTPLVTRWDTAGESVGFTLATESSHDVSEINEGTVHHPLFGDRRHWYTERVTPGWWSGPVGEVEPKVDEAVRGAVDAVVAAIDR